jgi:hypothetical protein
MMTFCNWKGPSEAGMLYGAYSARCFGVVYTPKRCWYICTYNFGYGSQRIYSIQLLGIWFLQGLFLKKILTCVAENKKIFSSDKFQEYKRSFYDLFITYGRHYKSGAGGMTALKVVGEEGL